MSSYLFVAELTIRIFSKGFLWRLLCRKIPYRFLEVEYMDGYIGTTGSDLFEWVFPMDGGT